MKKSNKEEALQARLERLKTNQRRAQPERQGEESDNKGYSYGISLATEMFAALAVGFGLGWGLDLWLGTKPWLMIILGFLGIAAGIINIWRLVESDRAKLLGSNKNEDPDKTTSQTPR